MRRSLVSPSVVVLLVLATAPAVTARLYASDEVEYYVYLRSLWFDGDVSFDNDYRHLYEAGIARTDGFRETLLERTTATGRRLNFATIGCAMLWAPFYAVGDLWAHVARWSGAPVATDGYSHPYIASVCYASAAYGWLALLLSGVAACRILRLSRRSLLALGVPLVVLAGTPLVFYMYVAPPFAHATSAFAVSAFTVTWLKVRPRWSPSGAALLGAVAALVVLVREQDAFLLLGPALDFVWSWWRAAGRRSSPATRLAASPPRWLGCAGAGAAAFVVVWLPQAFAYLALNGTIGPSPLLTRKMAWSSPHAAGVLFSPEHGLLWWTPLVACAIAGLVVLVVKPVGENDDARQDSRRIGVALLVMVAGQVYVTGCVASWTVAGAFGQRRFVALTPFIIIGLTVLASRLRARMAHATFAAALALCVWWNVGLMLQFGAGMMDRQRLDIRANARTTFLELPRRAPVLAYRYLFDRPSFYASPPVRR